MKKNMPTLGDEQPASLSDRLKAWPQYLLPQTWLSSLAGPLTRISREPLKNWQIRAFVRHFAVDMGEAAEPDPAAYATFNDFFTRALRPGARPLAPGQSTVTCPADGSVSALGTISGSTVLQAKHHGYPLETLLGDSPERAAPFRDGHFVTVYLSPRDYHRVHMPLGGRLRETVYIPGRLFSVNAATTRVVPRLFARNERLVSVFETDHGSLAVILVGAVFVGGIETVWSGPVTPPHRLPLTVRGYGRDGEPSVELARGAEMGRFNMGSTVIVLLPPGRLTWDPSLRPGAPVRVGQRLATLR